MDLLPVPVPHAGHPIVLADVRRRCSGGEIVPLVMLDERLPAAVYVYPQLQVVVESHALEVPIAATPRIGEPVPDYLRASPVLKEPSLYVCIQRDASPESYRAVRFSLVSCHHILNDGLIVRRRERGGYLEPLQIDRRCSRRKEHNKQKRSDRFSHFVMDCISASVRARLKISRFLMCPKGCG